MNLVEHLKARYALGQLGLPSALVLTALTLTGFSGYAKATAGVLSAVATIPNTDITGLGTMSTQNASGVAITGGTIAGLSSFGSTGAATFGSTVTIATGGSATLTIGDASLAGLDANIKLRTGSAKTAWLIGAQNNINNALEITPSTVAGGLIFNTPIAVFTTTGMLVKTATDNGVDALQVAGTAAFTGRLGIGVTGAYFRTDTGLEIQAIDAGLSLFQSTNPGTTSVKESFIAFGAFDSAGNKRKTGSISSMWSDTNTTTGFGVMRFNSTTAGGAADELALILVGGRGATFWATSNTDVAATRTLRINGALTTSGTITGASTISSTSGDVRAILNGSDTAVGGAFLALTNNAQDRFWVWQLSAANNMDAWRFDGAAWTKMSTYTTTGFQVNGVVSLGTAPLTNVGIEIHPSLTGSATVAGTRISYTIPSAATTVAYGYLSSGLSTAAAAFTVADIIHFYVAGATKGAGSTVTRETGLYVDDLAAAGTGSFGVSLNLTSGTGKWNLFAAGTASSFFQSNLFVGTQTAVSGVLMVVDAVGNSQQTAAAFKNTGAAAAFSVVAVWHPATTGDNNFLTFLTEAGGTTRGGVDFNRVGVLTRFNTTSDARFKRNIVDAPRTVSRDILLGTRMRQFERIENPGKLQIGVVADEVLASGFTGAVSIGDDGFMSVDKTAWSFHLISGWQDHDEKIESLSDRMMKLESYVTGYVAGAAARA